MVLDHVKIHVFRHVQTKSVESISPDAIKIQIAVRKEYSSRRDFYKSLSMPIKSSFIKDVFKEAS